MLLDSILESDNVIDATNQFRTRTLDNELQKVTRKISPPTSDEVNVRPSNQGNYEPPPHVLDALAHEVRATIVDMIESPDDYGFEDEDMAGISARHAIVAVCNKLLQKYS